MNKFFNRPIAPHLTIYVPQTLSLFSIWHRITSIYIIIYMLSYVCLYKNFFILDAWVFFSFFNFACYFNYLLFISLFYHLINGIKHLLWDLGFLLSKPKLFKFNILIFILIPLLHFSFFKNYLI